MDARQKHFPLRAGLGLQEPQCLSTESALGGAQERPPRAERPEAGQACARHQRSKYFGTCFNRQYDENIKATERSELGWTFFSLYYSLHFYFQFYTVSERLSLFIAYGFDPPITKNVRRRS